MAAIRLAVPGRGTKLCWAPFGIAVASWRWGDADHSAAALNGCWVRELNAVRSARDC
jgi:hypothetical protein